LLPPSGLIAWKSASGITRTARPFICSNSALERTIRKKTTPSSGLMSVPVAIMSTVTATRGL
jgi:hypothetical protein